MSRKRFLLGAFGVFTLAAAGVACSASRGGQSFDEDDSSGSDNTGSSSSNVPSTSSGGDPGGGFNPSTTGAGTMSGGGTCSTDPNVDDDGDGFTEPEDCNDCDPNVNPGAIDVVITEPSEDGGIPEPVDEDCDGVVDNAPATCDDNLALDDLDPMNGAKAIDLCQVATDKKWGVISAAYVRANGGPAPQTPQAGLLSGFGTNVNVQRGQRMLGLSSGAARTPGQPDACGSYSCSHTGPGSPPPGFPQNAAGCEVSNVINDDIGLELKIRAPKNATGYKYLFKFYSFEYAEYVCTSFNDQYIALVSPAPMGSNNGNISFDANKNPVSVNIAFFDVCDANSSAQDYAEYCNPFLGNCPAPPNPLCPSGASELAGTGFEIGWGEDAGGTSWLQSTAPITGGDEFTIRYAIWDTQDSAWDSTVLVDAFQWIATGGTVSVGTTTVPDPE